MGFSAASNRSEQQSHRHHSAPLDDAIGRCCSEFGVLAVSSGKVGKVDCCGLMRGAGASTAGLLLFLSLSFSIYLTLSHSLSGLPPLPPTVPHFVSLLSFPRLSLIYCRSIFCRTNYKKSTYTLTHVISSHYEVFSWCVSCTKCTNRYLHQVHVLTILTADPSWEVNRFSTSQEIPQISWNPKVHYRSYKSSPPVLIPSQINPVAKCISFRLLSVGYNT